MVNNVSEQDRNLAGRLSRNTEVANLLSDEHTEWSAIVEMQNMLDVDSCSRYMNALDHLGTSTVNATIEQRVEAFLAAMLKK